MARFDRQKTLAYLAAPGLVALAVLVRDALLGSPTEVEAELILLAVALVGLVGGLGPALLATAVGVLEELVTRAVPSGSLLSVNPHDRLHLGIYLVAGVGIAVTLEHLRRVRRRQAQVQRTLAMLTRCDEAVLRATTEAGLFADVCNLVVEAGGYWSCWMGTPDANGRLASVAATPAGEAPAPGDVDRSMREKRIVVAPASTGEVASVPLIHDGEVLGAFAIRAARRRAFGPDETRVLQQLSADVAFGVHAIRERAARERAEGERADAVATLENERARFRALIENSTDIILIIDPEGRIAFASPAIQEALGYPVADVLGTLVMDLVHPEDRTVGAEALAGVVQAQGHVHRIEVRVRRADGGWSVAEVIGRNLLDHPAVGGIVVNARDVTEQSRTRAQLLQAQKMEGVGRLAGGVAHDFNNLLTVILACGEDLRERIRDAQPPDPEAVDDIVEAADRAREMTRQLLAFARKHVAAPAVVDMNQVVWNTGKLLRRMVGEDVKVIEQFDTDVWSVRCDPGLVDQVLVNLAVNARDAMPGGGTLTLSTANVWIRPEDPLPDPTMRPGQYVRLSVGDTGTGMTPEVQGRIFEPFFTTKGPGVGTGLGLSMVYGIVRQSDAFLSVRSSPGNGTAFDIYFPRVLADPAAPRASTEPPRGGTETILLVEDEPRVRGVAERALRSGGYRVLVAGGPAEAESMAAAEAGTIHAIVTDVVMPGGSGPEVAGRICRVRPGTRVLYVSGYPDEVMERQGMADRVAEVLPKPFTPALLLRRVRELLDGVPD